MSVRAAETFLPEIIKKSARRDLRAVIEFLLKRVPRDCLFGLDDTKDQSKVAWSKKPPYRLEELRLGARAFSNMIWDLAHELGHVELGHQPSQVGVPEHERDAWDAGWKIIMKGFPFRSWFFRSEFVTRRNRCVDTYLLAGGYGDGGRQ